MRNFISILILLFANYLLGATYTVNNFSQLYDLLKVVRNGDTVRVNPGTYNTKVLQRTLEINKDITLEGTGSSPNDVRFGASGLISVAENIFTVKANNVTFKNLSINTAVIPMRISGTGTYEFIDTNITKTANLGSAIRTDKRTKKILVKNSTISTRSGSAGSYAMILKTDKLIVRDSSILAPDVVIIAIALLKSNDETYIRDSTLRGMVGFYAEKSNDVKIINTKITGGLNGVFLKDVKKATLINNTIVALRGGSFLFDSRTSGINIIKSNDVKILGNTIKGSDDVALRSSGIRIGEDVKNAILDYNCIYDGQFNLYIDDSATTNIKLRNTNFQSYREHAIHLASLITIRAEKNCFNSLKPLNIFPPKNSFNGNYWRDKSIQKLHDKKPLKYCPGENDCTYKYRFDAWDTFRDWNDRNISTKIANKTFPLSINVVDGVIGFEGTICAYLVDNNDILDQKIWQADDEISKNFNFFTKKAVKNARVKLKWLYLKNSQTCDFEATRTNSAFSTDNFAIRPNEFYITNPNAKVVAGNDFYIKFLAYDFNKTNTKKYNETKGTTFNVDFQEINTKSCMNDPLQAPTTWSFRDGSKEVLYRKNRSGLHRVSIEEKSSCSDRFSAVDCKDRNISGHFNSSIDTIIKKSSEDVTIDCIRSSKFYAYDNFRNPQTNRAISTKIANKPFTLAIASLTPTNENNRYDLLKFTGTVCARVQTSKGKKLTDWEKNFYNNVPVKNYSFSIPSASKDTEVKIVWKKSVNEKCKSGENPLVDETNSTIGSDHFAIKPKAFYINTNAIQKSGKNFPIEFIGLDEKNKPTPSYNEDVNDSFTVSYEDVKAPICINGVFDQNISDNWKFTDGDKNLTTNYNEIGIVKVKISDKTLPCDKLFARIDCNDSDVQGWIKSKDIYIGEYEKNITVTPNHFDINSSLKNFNEGDFTYLAKEIKQMYATLDINVSAKNKKGSTLKNYNPLCYAKDSVLEFKYKNLTLTPQNSLQQIMIFENNTSQEINQTINTNVNINFPKTIFKAGKAILKANINFDRDYTKPVSPFKLDIDDIDITDLDNTKRLLQTNIGSATFFYGRLKTHDIATRQKDITSSIDYEIYNSLLAPSPYTNWLQNSLHWYRNRFHTFVAGTDTIGDIKKIVDSNLDKKITATSTQNKITINNYNTANRGVQAFDIKLKNPANIERLSLHVQTYPWLWYSSVTGALPYNDITSCLAHPCFNIYYYDTTGVLKSGDFEGSDVNINEEANLSIKQGVKVFR